LHRKLSRYTHGFALDEKAWDASLSRPLLEGVRDLRWRFMVNSYKNEDEAKQAKTRLYRLYEDIIETVLTTGLGEYFSKEKGGPSGSGNTGPDNTLIIYALLAAGYYKITDRGFSQFIRDVILALYGDDNTMTVNPDVIDDFNGRSIRAFFARYGVEVKDENLDPRPLNDLDFLKKKFVVHKRSVVFRPVDPDKHLASLALRMTDPSPSGRLGRACAVRQLVVFCPREYLIVDEWCKKLIEQHAAGLLGDEAWVGAIAQYLPLDTLVAHFLRPQEHGQLQAWGTFIAENEHVLEFPGIDVDCDDLIEDSFAQAKDPESSKIIEARAGTPGNTPPQAGPEGGMPIETHGGVKTEGLPPEHSGVHGRLTGRIEEGFKPDGVLKTEEIMTKAEEGPTKAQRKNARRKAAKQASNAPIASHPVTRKVFKTFITGDKTKSAQSAGVCAADFPGLAHTATWVVHTIRAKYIDTSDKPSGFVMLKCGDQVVGDHAGKSPILWMSTSTMRKDAKEPAFSLAVERDEDGPFVIEISVTATLYPV